MAERLTKKKTTKGVTRAVIKSYTINWTPKRTKNYELMIQIMLEDEKGRDYEVLLEKILSHTKKQLDTWQKACELACDVLRDINYKIYNEDRIDFENSFYQQAKKEKENENDDTDN